MFNYVVKPQDVITNNVLKFGQGSSYGNHWMEMNIQYTKSDAKQQLKTNNQALLTCTLFPQICLSMWKNGAIYLGPFVVCFQLSTATWSYLQSSEAICSYILKLSMPFGSYLLHPLPSWSYPMPTILKLSASSHCWLVSSITLPVSASGPGPRRTTSPVPS